MYGKLFASMFDGSLYGNWKAIVTFQQMIVLCGPDGVVDMTPQALAARTSIPLDIIQEGIAVLEAPDQYSRSPEQDGRRIERLDSHRPWGWQIVNYRKYRQLVSAVEKREADRDRIAQKRRQARLAASSSDETRHNATQLDMSQPVAEVAQAEAEVNAPPNPRKRGNGVDRSLFDRFWSVYPRKASKGLAEKAFAKIAPDEQLVGRMCAAIERAKTSEQWRKDSGQFIPYPASWLSARGWEDEHPTGEAAHASDVNFWKAVV